MQKDDLILSHREQLPYLKDTCFLNFAATCPMPQTTIERMKNELLQMQEPLGNHFYQSLNQIEHIRRDLAEFIGAHPSEIAFTQNTSSAVSTIALSLKLKSGDIVLTPDNEFPSNDYPWRNLQQFGVIHRTFKQQENESIEVTLSKLDLTNVKVISMSAVSYETGLRIDIQSFADFCKEKRIISVVDAIQAIGTYPIHCHQLGIDFLASGSQKWLLGPVGCGFIYAKKEHLKNLFVPMVGWTSHKFPEYFDVQNLEFSDEMTRFEPGLPNYLPIIGLGESLKFFKEIGIIKIQQLIEENINYLISNLKILGYEIIHDTCTLRGGILCLSFPQEIDHRVLQTFFSKKKISVTVRENYIRVSPHYFTLKSELDQFLNAAKELRNEFPQFSSQLKSHSSIQQNLQQKFANLASDKKTDEIDQINSIQDKSSNAKNSDPIFINGATGNLGQSIAKILVQNGYPVFLLGQSKNKLIEIEHALRGLNHQAVIFSHCVDYSQIDWHQQLLKEIQFSRFSGLINCSGELSSELFSNLEISDIRRQFDIQFFAPVQLIKDVIQLKSDKDFVGIINIVSSSGRCGYPLFSAYAAAHASLWTLSETLGRELGTKLTVKTFVADSMHSPLQKLMGRNALRYYQIGKSSFNYLITEDVALEVYHFIFSKQLLSISKTNHMKIILNAIWPSFLTQQIRKVWSLK